MSSQTREIKRSLHDYICQSDLIGLKKYVDQMQKSILFFDDPSLLMMAIEIYLNPKCLLNEEFQLEIIVFLSKCGLKFGVPGGKFFLYLFEYCQKKEEGDSHEFEVKLVCLFDHLLGERTEILNYDIPQTNCYHHVIDYLTRHQAAFRIQRWWKKLNRFN